MHSEKRRGLRRQETTNFSVAVRVVYRFRVDRTTSVIQVELLVKQEKKRMDKIGLSYMITQYSALQ